MTPQAASELIRQALMTALWLSLPLLAVGFIAGILISLLQIVTSIQDPGFGSVPRLAAFLGALILFLPWILMKLMAYTIALFGDLGPYVK